MKLDRPIIYFKKQAEWRDWLEKNHDQSDGVWLKFYKKASGIVTVTYAQALDEALCFGWIDGRVKSWDDKAYLQRFTPRRPRSNWSKINTEHIKRLTKLGKMHKSGLIEVEKAKVDGRWEKAVTFESKIPEDFLSELAKHKKAYEFFKTLNKSNTYGIIWQIEDAKKKETRQRRIKKFVDMFSRKEKLY